MSKLIKEAFAFVYTYMVAIKILKQLVAIKLLLIA